MTLTIKRDSLQPVKRFTYQNFNAGEITSTSVILSKNENGIHVNNNALDFIASNVQNEGTPIIVSQSDYESGVDDSLGNRIKVNSINGATVTLSNIPANNVAVAIWYRYLEPNLNIVKNSLEISPNIENSLLVTKVNKVSNPNANDVAKINSDGGIENSNIQVNEVELNTNKTSTFQATPDDDKYPTEKLVFDNLNTKANKITGGTNGNIVTRDANGDIQDSLNSIANVKARSNHTGQQAISTITGLQAELDSKVPITDIKDDLTSTDTNKPLSANQGKILQDTKANKITSPTNGNLIKQDNNGDIVDTGVSGANFNNANQLVKLNSNAQLEAIDGSNLTGVISTQPIGTIVMSIASSITGAIACDGSSRLKTDYSSLYALITAELGANALEDPNNSNNFILPDLEGRVLGVAGAGRSLFDLVGSDTHTLTVNEIPSHKHDLTMTFHSATGGGYGLGRLQLTDRTPATQLNPAEMLMSNTGGGQAHNIVQKTAYIAKKVFIYYQ